MENASKALLIAGGVLIAIILIGLLLTGFTIIRSNENANVKAQATKELKEFNQKFEAYNKKALYGTDVITVMKMAIENNKKMETTVGEQYFINIVLDLTKTYTKTKKTVYRNGTTTEETDPTNAISGENYALGDWKKDGTLVMIQKVEITFGDSSTKKTENLDNTVYEYSALANLKKAVFKCKKVIYDDNGRIKQLEFTERN